MLHCLIPKRARAPLVTLAVQVDFGRQLEFEVLDTKIGNFLHPSPVVQEEQMCVSPRANPCQAANETRPLPPLSEDMCYGVMCVLTGSPLPLTNRRISVHALEVGQEGVQCCPPVIASTHELPRFAPVPQETPDFFT